MADNPDSWPWQPRASLAALQRRARTMGHIRDFFQRRNVLEVDVPVIGRHGVTDPSLSPIQARVNNTPGYLQTSPEYFLKRVVAADYGSVYYLGKAFRDSEYGRRHQPEFTMLEWYRLGFDLADLAAETMQLMAELLPDKAQVSRRYGELFADEFGLNPHRASDQQLAQLAVRHCSPGFQQADRNTWLDLLFSHCLEPKLTGVTLVTDYPASQCALARCATDEQGDRVAKRFEVFVEGIEIGNGYWELTDVDELRERMQRDCQLRQERGQQPIEPDPLLLAAQQAGLPACAGIAMGVDRIIMAQLGVDDLAQTLAFTPFTARP